MLKTKSAKVTDLLHDERFDVAAHALFKDVSRKKIKSIIDHGGAYLNKKRISIAKFQVRVGDKIELFWEEQAMSPRVDSVSPGGDIAKSVNQKRVQNDIVLFENENFYIINKPAGVASQATLTSSRDTIIHWLCDFDAVKFKETNLFLVHRLDKDTSGIMILARNKNTQKKFEDLFLEKKITKEYEALCFNAPKNMKGKILFPLAKDPARKNCYFAITNNNGRSKTASSTKAAETDYIVKKVFANGDASLISCYPKTGRTHQIRIHLSAIGCPVLGDKTYAHNILGSPFAQIAVRHMLHANKIAFTLDEKNYECEAPLPEDFARVIKSLTSQ